MMKNETDIDYTKNHTAYYANGSSTPIRVDYEDENGDRYYYARLNDNARIKVSIPPISISSYRMCN